MMLFGVDLNEVLCIIPARAGSVGLKDKNIKMLGSRPLTMHSVKHALDCGIPKQNVVLTTNIPLLINLSAQYGIFVVRRPEELCGPPSATEDAMTHALETWEKRFNREPKYIVLLQPTSPIRKQHRLLECLDFMINKGHDSILTGQKFYDFLWHEDKHDGDYRWFSSYVPRSRPMRQMMKRNGYRYFENGNIYICTRQVYISRACRIGYKVGVFPITDIESMQVDDQADWDIFELVYSGNISAFTGIR